MNCSGGKSIIKTKKKVKFKMKNVLTVYPYFAVNLGVIDANDGLVGILLLH